MKIFLSILFFVSISAHAQLPTCVQPTVVGNFTPILTLPANNYTFGIIATPHNNSGIASYSYSILTGSGTLVNANSQSASITNLTQGITSVMLIVADSCGSKDTSYPLITVNPAPPPTQLTATIKAANQTTSSVTLTVTSNGGTFTQYWSEVSGASAAKFGSQFAPSCKMTNLKKGTYIFQVNITATSGAYKGQSTYSQATVYIN